MVDLSLNPEDHSNSTVQMNITKQQIIKKLQQFVNEYENTFDFVVIILFGSFAEKVQHSKSDIDIGILYDKKLNNSQGLFNQHKKVRKLLEYEYLVERDVDVVLLNKAPLELQMSAVARGEVVYDKEAFLNYKEYVMYRYPDRKIENREIYNLKLN